MSIYGDFVTSLTSCYSNLRATKTHVDTPTYAWVGVRKQVTRSRSVVGVSFSWDHIAVHLDQGTPGFQRVREEYDTLLLFGTTEKDEYINHLTCH